MCTKGFHTKNYDIGKLLGKGGFGEVRVAEHKTTKVKRAIKYIKLSSASAQQRKEI